ncbi:MAG: hypothetical protein ACREV6_06020 [Clostridium sp.]|uniref:hypothetical protein n=1 Tax=Clostridium sp. TaxID=1506 RepID=UPI003D6D951D
MIKPAPRHDENWVTYLLDDCDITLCNRKVSSYINTLAKAGFDVEQMVEEFFDYFVILNCDKVLSMDYLNTVEGG